MPTEIEVTKGRVIDLLKGGDRAVYDVITAIRGPDTTQAVQLKYLFTARLRTSVGINNPMLAHRPESMTVSLAYYALDEAAAWQLRDREGYRHYLGHIISAAASLGEHNLATLARNFSDTNVEVTVERIIALGGGDA